MHFKYRYMKIGRKYGLELWNVVCISDALVVVRRVLVYELSFNLTKLIVWICTSYLVPIGPALYNSKMSSTGRTLQALTFYHFYFLMKEENVSSKFKLFFSPAFPTVCMEEYLSQNVN